MNHEGSPRFTKRQRNPKLKPFWILKARRKYAHDGVTLLVQRDRPAQHVRVAAKSALPEAVSENGRPGAVRRVLFPGEVASHGRPDAEQWKKIRRHCAGHDSFRRSGPCESHVAATVGGDARRRLALGFDFNERGAANEGAGAARPVCAQLHQLAGFGIGQRPEQDGIDHAEDGGVRADAQREREHGDRGEAGILQQQTEGVAKIVKHSKEGESEFRDVVEGCELRRIPARPSTIQEMVETDARNRI